MTLKKSDFHLSKTEIKEIEEMIRHIRIDLSYRGGGSFFDNNASLKKTNESDGYPFDEKAAKRVERAVETIERILANQ